MKLNFSAFKEALLETMGFPSKPLSAEEKATRLARVDESQAIERKRWERTHFGFDLETLNKRVAR